MRLTSIKISGFKSFAELSKLELPSNLIGIVGPNGCGKSNIIDAVRWVLGESRAAELRGESMRDVIFNGSSERNTASRASVELIFDNSDHRMGGLWAEFAEVGIRRVLTRDGASSYYVNSQTVRRKDVHDIFLGTGLGPRAYAIIGQGMISRIIESKPEELRIFLEEAAGVSKYKERRKETESRLKDSNTHLNRLHDILHELSQQIEKLQLQAAIAEQYQQLQQTEQHTLHQIWWVKRKDALDQQERLGKRLLQATTELDQAQAQTLALDHEADALQQHSYATQDELNQAQSAYFQIQSELNALETQMKFLLEKRIRAERDIEEFQMQQVALEQKRSNAQTAQQTYSAAAVQISAHIEQTQVEMDEMQEQLLALDADFHQKNERTQTQKIANATLQTNIAALSKELQTHNEALRKLENQRVSATERSQKLHAPNLEHYAMLKQEREQLEQTQQQMQTALQSLRKQLASEREAFIQSEQSLKAERDKLTQLEAHMRALQALQEKLRSEGKLARWLKKHGLETLAALWEKLHIESGYETALEAVLREKMQAREVTRLETAQTFVKDLPPEKFSFYSLTAHATLSPPPDATEGLAEFPPLSSKLKIRDALLHQLLSTWMQGYLVAPSLSDALAQRFLLKSKYSFVTLDGHIIDAYSISFFAADSEEAGMFARAQEIEALDKHIRADQIQVNQLLSEHSALNQKLQQSQAELKQNEQLAQDLTQKIHALELERLKQEALQKQYQSEQTQLSQTLAEVEENIEHLLDRQALTQKQFDESDAILAQHQQDEADCETDALSAKQRLHTAQNQLRAYENKLKDAHFQQQTLQMKITDAQSVTAETAQQMAHNQNKLTELQQQLVEDQASSHDNALEQLITLRKQKEEATSLVRSRLEDLQTRLRSVADQKMQLQMRVQTLQGNATQLQLNEQELKLRAEQFTEQLQADNVDLENFAATLKEGLDEKALQAQLHHSQQKIAGLGAVNLAALSELQQAKERKLFLDAQVGDLKEAIQRLGDAICEIDNETRSLLQSTFDSINEHYGKIFPSLFGGGHAKLMMTGGELLDAGVQVWAQPPGKKNSTIHLLSGGEKALTAIALVFAIFQLNPAPFCLLDEVDAPLDDANTERFCQLVTTMSKQTQFIFISHNKITMEMAQQLLGVTMQEQGVSRIVAVDLQTAAKYAS